MAIHSSILAWRIPWTEKPGGVQSMELQRVRHDWATNTHTHTSSSPGLRHQTLSTGQKQDPRPSLFASTLTPPGGGPATLQLGNTAAFWKLEIKGKRGGWWMRSSVFSVMSTCNWASSNRLCSADSNVMHMSWKLMMQLNDLSSPECLLVVPGVLHLLFLPAELMKPKLISCR